ncbi:MAG: DUF211 domain-containing protein [Candidatus Heimdallarchaeota archaeon]|nr:DUF211 domain-containing protein [Candidatus Heimdallarchaeota archaeon]
MSDKNDAKGGKSTIKVGGVRRLVLDVLKLHNPSLVSFATALEQIDGVNAVNCTLVEIDAKTENLKVVLEGSNMNYELISKAINDLHGSIHSIDQVISGKHLVEAIETPQD